MTLEEKMEIRRLEREREERKKCFTRVHRYLRLHSELLEDRNYKEMYEYYRNTLIAYFREDLGDVFDDKQLGEGIDVLADIFNENATASVNKYDPLVALVYAIWKRYPNEMRDIRI